MSSKKRRWWRIIEWTAAVLLLAAVAIAAVKYAIAPSLIRNHIKQACTRYWAGSVQVGSVEFNFSGPIRVRNVSLLDEQGQRHLFLGSMELVLKDWPSRQLVVREIRGCDMRLFLHRRNGQFVLPMRLPAAPDELSTYVDLDAMVIGPTAVALVEDGVERDLLRADVLLWNGLGHWGNFTARIDGAGSWPQSSLYVHAVTNSSERETLKMLCTIDTKNTPIISLPAPFGKSQSVHVDGPMLRGTVSDGDTAFFGPVSVTIATGDAPGRAAVISIDGAALGGSVMGEITIARGEAEPSPAACPPRLWGTIDVKDLELAQLREIMPADQVSTDGVLTGQLVFDSADTSPDAPWGSGQIVLEDVDASEDPLTRSLLAVLNGPAGNGGDSKIDAEFEINRSVATLRRATLVDGLRVMRVEPGGTVDLATREVDMYMVTLQLRGVSNLLARVPIVNLATILANKLTRLHVTGTWDDQKVSKEPVEDISAATLEFLAEAFATGGRIGPAVQSPLGQLLDLVAASAASQPATTAPAPNAR